MYIIVLYAILYGPIYFAGHLISFKLYIRQFDWFSIVLWNIIILQWAFG